MKNILNISGINQSLPLVGLMTGLMGVIILFRQLIYVSGQPFLWGNDFDPNLMVWILEWGYYSIFNIFDIQNFWNANQFYPHIKSLAYSDSLISAQLIYGPLRYIGLSALSSMYFMLAMIAVGACMFSDWVLIKIGGYSAIERMVVVYLAHFSLSTTTFLEGHYQLFGMMLAPGFFLLAYLYLRDECPRYLVLLALTLLFATGYAGYFLPMTLAVAAFAILLMWKKVSYKKLLQLILSTSKIQLALIVFIALLLITLLLPYKEIIGVSRQNMDETYSYSARITSILFSPSTNSLIYGAKNIDNGYWERSYFPGLLILMTIFLSFYYRKLFKEIEYNDILKCSLLNYSFIIFIAAYILSLGPHLFLPFSVFGFDKVLMPFYYLGKIIPGLENVRAPGRFGMYFGLYYGIALIALIRHFKAKLNLNSLVIKVGIIIICLLTIIDSLLRSHLYPYKIPHLSFYKDTAARIQSHEPTAVFPFSKNGYMETVLNYMDQLKGSTIHHGWVIAGYGSRSTDELMAFTHLDREFQSNKLSFNELLKKLKELHVKNIYIFNEAYTQKQLESIRKEIDSDGAYNLLISNDEGSLFKLDYK